MRRLSPLPNRNQPVEAFFFDRPHESPTAIFVRETQPTSTKLTPQEPVLFDQIVDELPFPAGQPAGQDHQQQLEGEGVDHGPQLISRPRLEGVG